MRHRLSPLAVALGALAWSAVTHADTLVVRDDAEINLLLGTTVGDAKEIHVGRFARHSHLQSRASGSSHPGWDGHAGERHGLLRFDLSTLSAQPPGPPLARATLRVWVNDVDQAGLLEIRPLVGPWSEHRLPREGAPATGDPLATVEVTRRDEGRFLQVDITPLVQEWLHGAANQGLALAPAQESPLRLTIDSKENEDTSHPPEIEVSFGGVAGPQGPTGETGSAGPAGPPGPGLASLDSLVGVACTLGGQAGSVAVAVAADGGISLRCALAPVPGPCDDLSSCNCSTGSMTFAFTGAVASFTVPPCVTAIRVDASGASGGIGTGVSPGSGTIIATAGGRGARMSGTFAVAAGTALSVLVGEQGQDKGPPLGFNGGGGGGSFVWQTVNQTLLIAAGGGGGAGGMNTPVTAEVNGIDGVTTANGTNGGGLTSGGGINGNGGTTPAYSPPLNVNGAGGAGWLSNGAPGFSVATCAPLAGGGQRPLAGGAGGAAGYNGATLGHGGFGGGGGAQGLCGAGGGGGAGGYSGGGGGANGTVGAPYKGGGGGGSFNGGTAQANTPGSRLGNGVVTITW